MILDFLTPVADSVIAHAKLQDKQSLGNSISFYKQGGEFPEIEKGALVLVGVLENRNDINYLGEQLSLNETRKAFCARQTRISHHPGNHRPTVCWAGGSPHRPGSSARSLSSEIFLSGAQNTQVYCRHHGWVAPHRPHIHKPGMLL